MSRFPLRSHALALCLATLVPAASRATVTINFDPLNALGAPVNGVPLDTYMAQFGVTITNNTAGTSVNAEDDRWSYGGGVVGAPSVHNYLLQNGGNSGESYRLTFSQVQSSVSFTRVAELTSSTWPQWSVQAFDTSNVAVGSAVGESLQGGTRAAQTFNLPGPGIKSIVVSGNGSGVAAYATAPIDDLFLPNAVPEPSAAAGALLVGAAFAARRRRAGSRA